MRRKFIIYSITITLLILTVLVIIGGLSALLTKWLGMVGFILWVTAACAVSALIGAKIALDMTRGRDN